MLFRSDDLTPNEIQQISLHSPIIQNHFASLSKKFDTAIVGGSLPVEIQSKIFNVATLYLPSGARVDHAKTHLFPGEHAYGIVEGDLVAVTEYRGVKMSMAICYEVEIPELVTAITHRGAELLLVPSFTSTPAGAHRVRTCAAARTIEAQIFVACAPAVGEMGNPVGPAFGQACVLSPADMGFPDDGILASGPADRQGVAIAELDLKTLANDRKHGNATTQFDRKRRESLYSTLAGL